jgi:hypothetical protein
MHWKVISTKEEAHMRKEASQDTYEYKAPIICENIAWITARDDRLPTY